VVEIFGSESSGKTTLALHTVAEAQKKGGICAFIDAEHALDPVYARKLGVVVDDLLISQPDAGEQALEIADTLVRSGAIDVLVIGFGRGARAARRARGRDGRGPARHAGPPDEPGAAQARRRDVLRIHSPSYAAEFLPRRPFLSLRLLKGILRLWTGKSPAESYRDDRLYVMRLASDFTKEADGAVTVSLTAEAEIDANKPVVLRL
jgi:hypothetical protein